VPDLSVCLYLHACIGAQRRRSFTALSSTSSFICVQFKKNVFDIIMFLTFLIIKNFGINVTQSSILMIFCIICHIDLLFNYILKIDGHCSMVKL